MPLPKEQGFFALLVYGILSRRQETALFSAVSWRRRLADNA